MPPNKKQRTESKFVVHLEKRMPNKPVERMEIVKNG